MYLSKAALAILLPAFLSLTSLAIPLAESSIFELPSLPHHRQHHPSSISTSSTAAAPTTTSNQETPEEFEATHDPNNPEDQQTNAYLMGEQQGQGGGNGK
ncbi:MAG: hypothetical protein OHK93_004961 [Ramalina farinacea]|uniref:Uncharacterized protein n=1 Tax=Ramalina farinacea TaxID=258253 RepID=A0AA43TYY5_9LECA|nr:hypothetical protein [Ramalina farinacea]